MQKLSTKDCWNGSESQSPKKTFSVVLVQLSKFKSPPHLVVHNDTIGSCVEQRSLGEELPLAIFVLLLMSLLHIERSKGVKRSHLILLEVSIVQASVCPRGLQDFDKVIWRASFPILKLRKDQMFDLFCMRVAYCSNILS